MRHRLAWAALLTLLAPPVAARTIEYNRLDPQGFAAEAARLKITPVGALPAATRPIMLLDKTGSHETLALGFYCSYKTDNPIGQLAALLNAELAAAAPASRAPLTITITQARSWRRCFEVAELNVRCLTTVKLAAQVEDAGQPARPVQAVVERDASVGGFCEDVARGVGVVTREAAQQLIAAALGS